MKLNLKIKGLDQAFLRKCPLCKEPLPWSPDYIAMSGGGEIAICNECGDVYDAINTMKTGDTSWMQK